MSGLYSFLAVASTFSARRLGCGVVESLGFSDSYRIWLNATPPRPYILGRSASHTPRFLSVHLAEKITVRSVFAWLSLCLAEPSVYFLQRYHQKFVYAFDCTHPK